MTQSMAFSLNGMKDLSSEISSSVDFIEKLAVNHCRQCTGDPNKLLQEYSELVKDYAKLQNEQSSFLEAFAAIRQQVDAGQIAQGSIKNELLNLHNQKKSELDDSLETRLVQQLQEKLNAALHPEEEDVVMEEDTLVIPKCPILGTQIEDPVKNKTCGHQYDRKGIMKYIKDKAGRAKCPVGACKSSNVVSIRTLETDRQLAVLIESQK